MREFSKVSPKVWRDRRFQSLTSTKARLAYFYFLTCEHQNSAGAYRVLDGYAAADLEWAPDEWKAARREVEEAGLVIFDEATSEVFICRWFQENPLTNNKHALGSQRLISTLHSDMVREAAEAEFSQSVDELEARIAKRSAEKNDPATQANRLARTPYLSPVR